MYICKYITFKASSKLKNNQKQFEISLNVATEQFVNNVYAYIEQYIGEFEL